MAVVSLILCSCLLGVTARDWRTPAQFDKAITQRQFQSGSAMKVDTIGKSRTGRPIRALRVNALDNRPAILIVAGIDGDHLLGSEVAMDVVDQLIARSDEESIQSLLSQYEVIVIPQVNPDAAAMYFDAVRRNQRRNLRPDDADRDGSIDEDSGDDLNGDGYITMMRVPDLEKATHLADPDNPRLNIKPDSIKGQSAQFAIYMEGADDDGDGKYNEDARGGVDLNRNYMHGYEPHADGSGPWQVSEPESLSLLRYVLDHQEIAAVVVYGVNDTLTNPPTDTSTLDSGAVKQIHEGDKEMYAEVSKLFREITGLESAPKTDMDGSFAAWSYAQFGVPTFSTPLWTGPAPDREPETKEEDETATDNEGLTPSGVGDISQETLDELLDAAEAAGFPVTDEMKASMTPEMVEQYAKMSGITIRRVAEQSNANKNSGGDAAWLAYSDNNRNGAGFIEWAPFEHPQLGTVEIGGWVPYFRTLPPTDEIQSISEKQVEFLLALADRLPDVHLGDPTVTQLADQLWEVKVPVINDGWLPSGTAMAEQNKRARPHVVRLETPNDTVVSGQRVQRLYTIPGSGAHQWYQWIITGDQDTPITITLFSEKYGTTSVTVPLTHGGGA
jgi:hypothetical protein